MAAVSAHGIFPNGGVEKAAGLEVAATYTAQRLCVYALHADQKCLFWRAIKAKLAFQSTGQDPLEEKHILMKKSHKLASRLWSSVTVVNISVIQPRSWTGFLI